MYLLSVNLYELGQFLQILLWISLPMVLIALLVTTYLHYRNKRRDIRDRHSPEDVTRNSSEEWEEGKIRSSNDRLAGSLFVGDPTAALPEEGGNAYRGLLWMKDKYEQYREHTDRKFEKLKEELARAEEKYLNLLAARQPLSEQFLPKVIPSESSSPEIPPDNAGQQDLPTLAIPLTEEAASAPPSTTDEKERQIELLQLELEQRIRDYHQMQHQYQEEQVRTAELSEQHAQTQELVKARQFEIEELNTRLLQQQHKLTDLTYKLECNTQLLLRIHQELDSTLHEKENHEVSKIVG